MYVHRKDHAKKARIALVRSLEPFPKRQILDSSKLKEFADDNFEFDANSWKLIM